MEESVRFNDNSFLINSQLKSRCSVSYSFGTLRCISSNHNAGLRTENKQCRVGGSNYMLSNSVSLSQSKHLFSRRLHQRLILPHVLIQIRQESTQNGDGPPDTPAWNVETANSATDPLAGPEGYIPKPPSAIVETPVDEGVSTLAYNELGEPTFASLGLNNYTPVGLAESLMEAIHYSAGVPWVGTIIITTVLMRTSIMPLLIYGKKHMTNYQNHMPTVTRMNMRLEQAKAQGDRIETMRVGKMLNTYMEKHQYSPIKGNLPLMLQGPVFMSMIFAMRAILEAVGSLQTGGPFWCPDLCAKDPYYVAPVSAAVIIALNNRISVDKAAAENMNRFAKIGIYYVFPAAVFGFVCFQPSGIGIYMVANSTFTLTQTAILNNQKVRDYFGIPQAIDHSKAAKQTYGPKFGNDSQSLYSGGFKMIKENMAAQRKVRELQDRDRTADMEWKKAGSQPIPKTYKSDPTKVKAQ